MIDSDLRFGYYAYNDKCFFNREQVYEEIEINGDYDAKLLFVYNTEIFDKINWHQSIDIDILDLYKARAIQLRQSYSELILMFSGGSDSMQILNTFVKNKIKLDEIRIFSYDKMIQAYGESRILSNPELKILLEYKNAALKTIEQIRSLIPDTVINHIDMTNDMIEDMSSKNSLNITRPGYVGIGAMSNSPNFFTLSSNLDSIKRHKETSCLIYGIEKPVIKFDMKTQMLRFHFSDSVMRNYSYCKFLGFTGLNIEPFYWTKDFPYIPIKQSQMIKQYLINENEARKKFYKLHHRIAQETNIDERRELITELSRMFDTLIYPNWIAETFVAKKPRKTRHEFFVYEQVFGKTYSNQMYDEVLEHKKNRYNKIKNKLFKGNVLSKPYNLGKIPLPVI